MSKGKTKYVLGGLMAALLAGSAFAQTGGQNVDWPVYMGDINGSRFKPLDQINASNFSNLEVAWRFKTDNLGNRPEFKLEGTPLEVNGAGPLKSSGDSRTGSRTVGGSGSKAPFGPSAPGWPPG